MNTDVSFEVQYTKVYQTRLKTLKPRVVFPEEWQNSAKHIPRVLDITPNTPCYFSGCLTREAQKKPNIFKDLDQINHGILPVHGEMYSTPEDKFFLEDEHGRVVLTGELLNERLLVSGVILGVRGVQNSLGEFKIDDVCFPDVVESEPFDLNKIGRTAFISGINIDDSTQILNLLSFITSQKLEKLIICGNCFPSTTSVLEGSRVLAESLNPELIVKFDKFLTALVKIVEVYIIPAEKDPVPLAFPQSRIHPALLANARLYIETALHLEQNPASININGIDLLVTGGQPVKDLQRYAAKPSPEILELCVKFAHLAPSGPYTLCTLPFTESDPLVLDKLPNVLVSGNSAQSGVTQLGNTLLVCVPEFTSTNEVILAVGDKLEIFKL